MHIFRVLFFMGFTGLLACSDALAGELAGADVVLRMGGNGPRPYVALWIEDDAGKRIRTLHVWGNKLKYQQKLREWKKGAGAVDGISGATRPNGDYVWMWDGLDDEGKAVPFGGLVFWAESAREDGAHCKTSVPLDYSGKASRAEGAADRDILGLFVRTPSAPELTEEEP